MPAKPHLSNAQSFAEDKALTELIERLGAYYPRAIDPNLERTFRLLHDLGDPHQKLPPVIHIAGTNGKGSTLATVRAIAETAGLSCHVMTSPHLVRFNERLVLAGEEMPTAQIIDLLLETERLNAKQPVTSFEIITAAGLLAFARTPADLCLLETGMGGRLDATNVIAQPLATIITVISYDHMQYLGTTLPAIAAEKAGIMKAKTPCIVGPQTAEALRAGVMTVFEDKAAELGAPLYRHGYEWSYEVLQDGFMLHTPDNVFHLPRPNLLGAHQIGNAATAVMTMLLSEAGLPQPLDSRAIEGGITTVRWPARLQRLTRGSLPELLPEGYELWLDGGHNDTGGQVLAEQARAWAEQDKMPLHVIAGMLNTKDPRAFLRPLLPHAQSFQSLQIPGQALSLSADELASAAREVMSAPSFPIQSAINPEAAIRQIIAAATRPCRILITGSLYLSGEILKESH